MAYTYKPGDEYKNIIEKINLNEVDKETLRIQWVNELNYSDKSAVDCQKKYLRNKIVVFICGVLIPVVTNLKFTWKFPPNITFFSLPIEFNNLMLTTILGVIVAIGTGLNQILKYEDKWTLHRRNAELLKNEGENFFGLGNVYRDAPDHQSAFRDFNTNVAAIKKQDVSNYFEKVISKDKEAPVAGVAPGK